MAYNIKLVRVFHNGLWHVAEFEDLEMPYLDTNQYKFCLNIKQLYDRIAAGLEQEFNVDVELAAMNAMINNGETLEGFELARAALFKKAA
jgi:hypothetical protein